MGDTNGSLSDSFAVNASAKARDTRSLEVFEPVSTAEESQVQRLLVGSFHSHDDNVKDDPTAGSRGLSFWEAVVNFVIASVGAGVAIFPSSMGKVGFVAAPLLMGACAAACSESGNLICIGCDKAESYAGQARGSVASYEDFAGIAGGRVMLRCIMVTKNFTMLGCIVAYILFVTDSLYQLLDAAVEKLVIRFFIVMPLFIVLAMVKDLRVLARFQSLGLLAVIVECGSMVIGSLIVYFSTSCTPPNECPTYEALQLNAGEFGKSCAVFIFSFAIIKTVPSVRTEMTNPQSLPTVLRCSFLLIYAIYIVVMGTGYLAFGNKVRDNIIDDLNAHSQVFYLGKAASLGILVNLLVSTPIYFVCIIRAFEVAGKSRIHEPLSLPNVLLRGGIVVFLTLVASLDSIVALCQGRSMDSKLSPKDFISLISSVFNTCNTTFWPLSLFYLLRKLMAEAVPQSPPWRWVVHILQACLGICVLIFGFMESIIDIGKKLN